MYYMSLLYIYSIITDVISALPGVDSIFYNDSSSVAGISRFWRWMVLNSPGFFLLHQKTVEYKDTRKGSKAAHIGAQLWVPKAQLRLRLLKPSVMPYAKVLVDTTCEQL